MSQKRLFWGVVDKIEAKIASGEYVPGSRLPPERVLAEEFNVSRPTIREAIIALEVRGKVEVKTSSGVYLLEQPESQDVAPLSVSPFELTQARALVEGEAAALAASNITDEQIIGLKKSIIDMQTRDPDQADHTFHNIISEATRNKAIAHAVERFWELRETVPEVKEAYSQVCEGDGSKRLKEHQMIVDALEQRNPEAARAAMHQHFNRLINALFEASEAKALEEVKSKSSRTRDLYSLDHLI